MPLTSTEYSRLSRERKKLAEEEKKEKERERCRLRMRAKREFERKQRQQQQQQQRTMSSYSSGDGEEDPPPPPPVETPARRDALPPIAEMSPFQIQALERSRQRQQAVAVKSINSIDKGIDRINGIYAEEHAAEDNFQQAVLGMSAGDLPLSAESSPKKLAAAAPKSTTKTPRSGKGMTPLGRKKPPVASSSAAHSVAFAPSNAASTQHSSKTPRVPSSSGAAAAAAATPRSSKKPPGTPSTAARKRKASASKPVPKKRTKHMPAIYPTFAMIAPECYKDQKSVLEIGQGAGTWQFEVLKHLTTIQESYTEHDFYLVGYRNEERPVIASIHKSDRIHIPYIAVHALPKGTAHPNWVVESDLEKKTEKIHSLQQLPLKWVQVGTFPTGQAVMMLESTARKTSRALATQGNECSGGQFWFAVPMDDNKNPGEGFKFPYDDDVLFFPEDAWINTQRAIKRMLKQDGETWADFCRWDGPRWLELLLGVAVDKFFEYEDDLPRDDCETEVTELLAEAFGSYKKSREAEEKVYEQHRSAEEKSSHFKIYPENECIVPYLSGDCSVISKWCGKAEAVYPHVPAPVPPPDSGPKRDLWGTPKRETPLDSGPKLDLWGNPKRETPLDSGPKLDTSGNPMGET